MTSNVPPTSTQDINVTPEATSQTTNTSTTALLSTIGSTSTKPSTTTSTLHTTTIASILSTMVGNILTTTTNAGKLTSLGVLSTTTTTTTAPAVTADEEVSGVIKIEEEFDQSLLDPTSDAFKKKVDEILELVGNHLRSFFYKQIKKDFIQTYMKYITFKLYIFQLKKLFSIAQLTDKIGNIKIEGFM